MILQRMSSRWFRGGLAIAALFIVLLAILLLPRVTRGQDSNEGQAAGQSQEAASVGPESVESPFDLNNSPYVIGAGAFVSDGYQDGEYLNRGWDGFLDRISGNTGYVCFVAPIKLKDGVTIDNFEVYAVDNDPSYVIRNRLYRKQYNYGAGGADQAPSMLREVWSSSSSPNIRKWTTTSVNAVVDNSTYHYYIESCPYSSLHQVYSYRVNWSN